MKFTKAISAAQAALDQAKADLAAAQARKEQIAASEAEAATTVESYTEWRRQSLLASTEVERVTTLIARREAELQAEVDKAAAAEQKALEEAFEASAKTAAAMITKHLPEITRLGREMIKAIAESEQKREAAQANRSPDLPRLIPAEERVRAVPGVEREVISEKTVMKWVFSSSGNMITDEDKLKRIHVYEGGKTGSMSHDTSNYSPNATLPSPSPVELRPFRHVKFYPAVQSLPYTRLAESLEIPPLRAGDAPGWSLAPSSYPSSILNHLNRLIDLEQQPRGERKIEEEFIAVKADEAPAKGLISKVAGFVRGATADA